MIEIIYAKGFPGTLDGTYVKFSNCGQMSLYDSRVQVIDILKALDDKYEISDGAFLTIYDYAITFKK